MDIEIVMWGFLQTYISNFETFLDLYVEIFLSVVFTSLILLEFEKKVVSLRPILQIWVMHILNFSSLII
jgi:hypothetical protein